MSKKTVWDLNPKMKRYFETTDGTYFFKETDARVHARSLDDKNVKEVKRPAKGQSKPASKNDDLTPMQKANLRIEANDKLETVEELEKALKGETAKTVKEAGKLRIEALKASQKQD